MAIGLDNGMGILKIDGDQWMKIYNTVLKQIARRDRNKKLLN